MPFHLARHCTRVVLSEPHYAKQLASTLILMVQHADRSAASFYLEQHDCERGVDRDGARDRSFPEGGRLARTVCNHT